MPDCVVPYTIYLVEAVLYCLRSTEEPPNNRHDGSFCPLFGGVLYVEVFYVTILAALSIHYGYDV